jgi:hypothetical protein
MTKFTSLLLLALAGLTACSRSSSGSADSASSTAALTVVARTPRAVASSDSGRKVSTCPRTGLWALCSVEQRLSQSGFVVSRVAGSPPRRPGFSVAPAVYKLGKIRMEVFIYPSEAAVSADVARIDTVFAAPRGSKSPWGMGVMPTFVRSANLAAVLLTDNATQAERFTLAITAGAPQP